MVMLEWCLWCYFDFNDSDNEMMVCYMGWQQGHGSGISIIGASIRRTGSQRQSKRDPAAMNSYTTHTYAPSSLQLYNFTKLLCLRLCVEKGEGGGDGNNEENKKR